MTFRSILSASACVLALGAFDGAAAPASPAPSGMGDAAASGCSTTLGSNDAMRFSTATIAIPASCTKFTIRLEHNGKLPVTVMGHSVVIAASGDMAGVLADGVAAGAANGYVKPGDARVIAHTRLIGGGESASVTFPVEKLKGGGPWAFFCSFPGHAALMKGTVTIR